MYISFISSERRLINILNLNILKQGGDPAPMILTYVAKVMTLSDLQVSVVAHLCYKKLYIYIY